MRCPNKLLMVALVIALALLYLSIEQRAVTKAAGTELPTWFLVMTNPLGCDARVAQRGAGEKWVSLCYIKSSTLSSTDER